MCLGRMPEYPQPQIYLNGMILQWVKNAIERVKTMSV